MEVFDDMFRVNLFRNVQNNVNDTSFGENFGDGFGESDGENFGNKNVVKELGKEKQRLTDTQLKILECLVEDKYISAKKLRIKLGYLDELLKIIYRN